MYKNVFFVISICLSFLTTFEVQADYHRWYETDGGVDRDFNNPQNWSFNLIPGPSDNAICDTQYSGETDYPILSSGNYDSLSEVYIGWDADGTLEMTGGVIKTSGFKGLTVGWHGHTGKLLMKGGSFTLGYNSRIYLGKDGGTPDGIYGFGIIEMTGGEITQTFTGEPTKLWANSYINVHGGVLSVEDIQFMATGTAHIDVNDAGVLIIRNEASNYITDVDTLIAAEKITGNFTKTVKSNGAVVLAGLNLKCGSWGYDSLDWNQDCYVNLSDFATFAEKWLYCTDPQNASCFNLKY